MVSSFPRYPYRVDLNKWLVRFLDILTGRAVNRFWKRCFFVSFFDRFQIRLFRFRKKRSFWKTTHPFWTFRKWSFFWKTIWDCFLHDCFLKTIAFVKTIVFEKKIVSTIMVTIVNKGSLLTIVNEELSLTIVSKTTNFIKTVVCGKNLHATLLNVVLHEV